MELKPESNFWSSLSPTPFNRTRMELKLTYFAVGLTKKQSFNRTRMELKLINYYSVLRINDSFNRTRMELKLKKALNKYLDTDAFNRTRMELKPYSDFWHFCIKQLLIAPEWN